MRLLPAALLLTAAAAAYARPAAVAPVTELPRDVRPTAYRITVTPDAPNLRFAGQVSLDVNVVKPTPRIVLLAHEITVKEAHWRDAAGHTQPLTAVADPAHDTITFTAGTALNKGAGTLDIAYEGVIGTQAAGFFALDYTTDSGAKERALYTQFESHDARRFVPSFDEPAFRTPFTLDVILPPGRMAVSNLPVERTIPEADGRVRWHFPATPPMSTYLLFLGVGDFERSHVVVEEGRLEAGVVTRRGVVDQGAFALEGSREVIRDYERWFDKPFPLPKLDNIAAPGQSQFFGAMENWGAIFTFEHALLADPALATPLDKQRIFEIAAHEIAHQWFGDLVTMQWWDDLWLNEGFASWMEGRATERLHPEWETASDAVMSRESAMFTDALATTHPIVQHLKSALDVDEAFDSITYQKGNAVLRMLETYVGAELWQAGVRRYIAKHAYSNTTSDDLWAAIESVTTTPVTPIAHAFVNNPGIPLVHVRTRCDNGATQLELLRDEFQIGPHPGPKRRWPVPVTYLAPDGSDGRLVLTHDQTRLKVPGCGAVLVNGGGGGYYRVDYDQASFDAIAARFNTLSVSDRLAIVHDRLALARTGAAAMADVLRLIAMTPATAPAPLWNGLILELESLHSLYAATDPGKPALEARIRALMTPLLARVGWVPAADETLPTSTLREETLLLLAEVGDSATLNEAKRRYQAAAHNPAEVPATLRKTIDMIVAESADADTFEAMRKAAAEERSPAMQAHLYTLLGQVKDHALAMRALNLALSDEPPKTISSQILREVARNYPEETYRYVMDHLNAVRERVDGPAWSRYVPSLFYRSVDPAMPARIRAFTAKEMAGREHKDADRAALSLDLRLEQRGRLLPAIDAWVSAAR